jgi:hypothetical protein
MYSMKLGDSVAQIATPIARTLGLPCIDPETQNLRPDSPCAKRKLWLNNLGDSFYDIFWSHPMETEYIVTKQISVKAESPEEAVAKSKDGNTISVNAVARPPQPPQPSVSFASQRLSAQK